MSWNSKITYCYLLIWDDTLHCLIFTVPDLAQILNRFEVTLSQFHHAQSLITLKKFIFIPIQKTFCLKHSICDDIIILLFIQANRHTDTHNFKLKSGILTDHSDPQINFLFTFFMFLRYLSSVNWNMLILHACPLCIVHTALVFTQVHPGTYRYFHLKGNIWTLGVHIIKYSLMYYIEGWEWKSVYK